MLKHRKALSRLAVVTLIINTAPGCGVNRIAKDTPSSISNGYPITDTATMNMPPSDLPPSRLTNNASIRLILHRTEPVLALPHESGRLEIEASRFELELGIPELFEDPDRSDVLRLRSRLADATGRLHIADSFIAAERLWRTLSGRSASSTPPTGVLQTLHEDAKVYVPSGDEWVFLLQTQSSSAPASPAAVLVREKYFSASLSLHCLTMSSTPRFYARVTPHVDLQRVDGGEVASGISFWFEIPAEAILWNTGMHFVALDEDERWWEPSRFKPLVFRATQETGDPNKGIDLKTD